MTKRLYVLDLECPKCHKVDHAITRVLDPLPEYECTDCATAVRITGCEVEQDIMPDIFGARLAEKLEPLAEQRPHWSHKLTGRSTKQ